jgi:hypothetical protein
LVDDLLILTLSPEMKLEAGDDSNDAANTAAPEKTIGEVVVLQIDLICEPAEP